MLTDDALGFQNYRPILFSELPITDGAMASSAVPVHPSPLSQSRFNPKGAVREDLGDVLKPKLEPRLDA